LFEIGERRVDDAGAWRIEAIGHVLDVLDDLVSVAGLLLHQRQDHQAQVTLHQEAADTAVALVAEATPAAMTAAMTSAAAPGRPAGHCEHRPDTLAPMSAAVRTALESMLEHIDFLFRFDISKIVQLSKLSSCTSQKRKASFPLRNGALLILPTTGRARTATI